MTHPIIPKRLDPEISPRQADAFQGLVMTLRASAVLDAADAVQVLTRDGLAEATAQSILKDAVNYGLLTPIRQKGRAPKILAYRLNAFFDYWETHHDK